MIPLKDNIPTDRFPVVTVAFIAINVLVFIWQLTYSTDPQLGEPPYDLGSIDQSSLEYGAIPYRITHPDEKADCAIGPVETGGQIELGVVCPGTAEYDEAVLISTESVGPAAGIVPATDDPTGLELQPLAQAAWFVTLFTSMFMHGGLPAHRRKHALPLGLR